ncbi:MAG: hypothetical protein QXT33_04270 [Thermofilum sp.]|uniref:B-block binding subunit of TFIIIC domain-containing protein n=1 Tax=Thermofilum pendens TaxID=2269 RepID=A0A7C4H7N0_THEPE
MPSRQRAFEEEDVERLEEYSVKYEMMEKKVYETVLEAGDTGIMQRDLWRKIGLDSRLGMRILRRLERQGLVKREEIIYKGRRSYLVRAVPSAERELQLPDFLDEVPCFYCPNLRHCAYGERDILSCPLLNRWLNEEDRGASESIRSSES